MTSVLVNITHSFNRASKRSGREISLRYAPIMIPVIVRIIIRWIEIVGAVTLADYLSAPICKASGVYSGDLKQVSPRSLLIGNLSGRLYTDLVYRRVRVAGDVTTSGDVENAGNLGNMGSRWGKWGTLPLIFAVWPGISLASGNRADVKRQRMKLLMRTDCC
jgi:hypothetical protein